MKAHSKTKRITFRADENHIESARNEALNNETTLNEMFQSWLEKFAKQDNDKETGT